MIEKRPANEMGSSLFEGASAVHHFCFGRYQSPDRLSWGPLRVLNRIRLEPGSARDPNYLGGMDVLVLVESGEIVVRCGEQDVPLQAGAMASLMMGVGADFGIANPSSKRTAELVEIWLTPEASEGWPKLLSGHVASDMAVLASQHAAHFPILPLSSPAAVTLLHLAASERVDLQLRGEHAYIWLAEGEAVMGDFVCRSGDAIALQNEPGFSIAAAKACKCFVVESLRSL
jgi:redox-sensitive bicupin YhaK (pirin superfamily)